MAQPQLHLQLEGTNGNAFALLARFQNAARRAGWTNQQITAVVDDATSGDYNHLLSTLTAV